MGDADVPKPMQRVGGIPMVERLLRQMADAGIRRVTVVTGWLGEVIEDHLRNCPSISDAVELTFLREPRPLGNAGALSLVERDLPVLMAFGDLVTSLDFRALLAVHFERQGAVTLASHHEEMRVRLGEIVAHGEDVVAYREKPLKRFLICSGIAVLEPCALPLARSEEPVGLSDLVERVLAAGHRVTHWLHGAKWIDANTPSDLASADSFVLRETHEA